MFQHFTGAYHLNPSRSATHLIHIPIFDTIQQSNDFSTEIFTICGPRRHFTLVDRKAAKTKPEAGLRNGVFVQLYPALQGDGRMDGKYPSKDYGGKLPEHIYPHYEINNYFLLMVRLHGQSKAVVTRIFVSLRRAQVFFQFTLILSRVFLAVQHLLGSTQSVIHVSHLTWKLLCLDCGDEEYFGPSNFFVSLFANIFCKLLSPLMSLCSWKKRIVLGALQNFTGNPSIYNRTKINCKDEQPPPRSTPEAALS